MDLSSPLAVVTPTLDAGVLQVLAATTSGCTAAEVHRRLGRGSDEGVRKVLGRLVDQGLVRSSTLARYPVYELNRAHLAAPHVVAIVGLRSELLARMAAEISGWAVRPVHAGLFGSFARGEAGTGSDIDLLLVRPEGSVDDDTWTAQVDRLEKDVLGWTGNATQVVDVTTDVLNRMAAAADPLVDSWRADEVLLYGKRLADLLRGRR